jgi:hypothetical protein
MKKLLLTLCTILVAAPVAATVDITVRNLGNTVYLREAGLPYMNYLPSLRSPLLVNQNAVSIASSNLYDNQSIKATYRTGQDNSSPGCEFVFQMLRINQDSPWQVLKVVATELNRSPKASLQCSSQLTGFDSARGRASIIFTIKSVKFLAGRWVEEKVDPSNPDDDPAMQTVIQEE